MTAPLPQPHRNQHRRSTTMTPFIETLTDSDGDECSFMHYDQPGQDPTSGVYVQASVDGEVVSAGPFTPEALYAALDDVAPASSDTRTRSLRNDRHYWQTRAEKAEKERDEARRYECSDLDAHWRLGEALASLKEANATVASLRAEQPRPLTADDIEQLVTQNRCRVADAIRALYPEEPMATDVLANAVMTALTEPTRPEGAEELARLIAAADVGEWDCGDLADALLATGRVRVITEERS